MCGFIIDRARVKVSLPREVSHHPIETTKRRRAKSTKLSESKKPAESRRRQKTPG